MEITLKIDQRKKEGKALIEYLRQLSFVEFESKPRYNEETEKAIIESRLKKNTPLSLTAFRKQLYS